MSHRIGSIGNVIRLVRTLGWDSMIASSAGPSRLRSSAERPGRGSPSSHAVMDAGGGWCSRSILACMATACLRAVPKPRLLLPLRAGTISPRSLRMRRSTFSTPAIVLPKIVAHWLWVVFCLISLSSSARRAGVQKPKARRRGFIGILSKIAIGDLCAGDAGETPCIDDAAAILEHHHGFKTIDAKSSQELDLDHIVVAMIAIGAHIEAQRISAGIDPVIYQPLFGLGPAAFGTARHEHGHEISIQRAGDIDHVLDRTIGITGIEEGVPLLWLALDQVQPMIAVG